MDSISEKNGIGFLSNVDRKIYSVGISTGGQAEIKMAQIDANRCIIATTIDLEGAKYARERIREAGLSAQIEVRVEDVSQPLPYSNDHFDYIYARLVLHYLAKDALTYALAELYRILRIDGRIFVVVRSVDCAEAQGKASKCNALTGLTTYSSGEKSYSRYFHSQESISHHLSQAGFAPTHIDAYPEQLYVDFKRTKRARQIDHLIEVLAKK